MPYADEQWIQISYPGLGRYDVSNYGRIRSRITGKILSTCQRPDGYITVGLYYEPSYSQKVITMGIHRIVADHFLSPPRPGQDTVHHIDYDRSNNHYSNLEWLSRSDNTRESQMRDHHGGFAARAVIISNGEQTRTCRSIREAAKIIGRCNSNVYDALQKQRLINGWLVQYVDKAKPPSAKVDYSRIRRISAPVILTSETEELYFSSRMEAAKSLGVTPQAINQAVRKGRQVQGYFARNADASGI